MGFEFLTIFLRETIMLNLMNPKIVFKLIENKKKECRIAALLLY